MALSNFPELLFYYELFNKYEQKIRIQITKKLQKLQQFLFILGKKISYKTKKVNFKTAFNIFSCSIS